MDISLILKIAGIGIIISVANQILCKYKQEEQATLLTVIGIIVVMILIASELDTLLTTLQRIFGL